MTTGNFALGYVQDRACGPSFSQALADRMAVAGLSLTFFLSFTQYCFERSDLVRLVPFGTLVSLAIVLFSLSLRENRREILTALFRPSLVLLITVVCVPSLISSLYRPTAYPFEYGIAMIVLLLAVRGLLSAIGAEGILRAYAYGTTAGILLVVALSLSDLASSIGATRYSPLFYDPNRIGFFAVTAIPAQVWMSLGKPRNKLVLFASVLCIVVMAAASSRGSIGAVIIGATVSSALYMAKRVKSRALAFSRAKVVGILALLCIATIAIGAKLSTIDDAGTYLAKKLAIQDSERGMDSGFTGRTGFWAIVVGSLPKTSWVFGNGYRTSEDDFSFAVDNGYLAAVYEVGAIATLIIVGKYVLSLYQLARAYKELSTGAARVVLTVIFTMVAFFANAFVHRVLFGYGDPASILALFLFVGHGQDLGDLPARHTSD